MKYKCNLCKTEWEAEELRHHPYTQEWADGELVSCPYCWSSYQASLRILADAVRGLNMIKNIFKGRVR